MCLLAISGQTSLFISEEEIYTNAMKYSLIEKVNKVLYTGYIQLTDMSMCVAPLHMEPVEIKYN